MNITYLLTEYGKGAASVHILHVYVHECVRVSESC